MSFGSLFVAGRFSCEYRRRCGLSRKSTQRLGYYVSFFFFPPLMSSFLYSSKLPFVTIVASSCYRTPASKELYFLFPVRLIFRVNNTVVVAVVLSRKSMTQRFGCHVRFFFSHWCRLLSILLQTAFVAFAASCCRGSSAKRDVLVVSRD